MPLTSLNYAPVQCWGSRTQKQICATISVQLGSWFFTPNVFAATKIRPGATKMVHVPWASFRRGDSQQKRLVKGEPGIWAPRFFRCSREIRSWMVQGICLFHLFMWENGIIAIWTIHEFLVFRNGAIGVTSRVVFFCGSCRSEGCFIPDNRSSCASMCWHWTIP